MELLPSPEEQEMIDTVDNFLTKKLSISHARERISAGRIALDDAARREVAELGIFSLALPETADGAGCSVVEESLVYVPFGRHLAPLGFLAATVAARLAHSAAATEARDSIASGVTAVGLGVGSTDTSVDEQVAGPLQVFDRPESGYVLVVSSDGKRLSLIDAEEVVGDERPCLDATISLTDVVDLSPTDAIVAKADEQLSLVGTLLVTAMMSGVADAARDQAVSYASEREQFGRPIGVNQAIKHPCADMAVRCEAATSLLSFAAVAVRDGRPDAAFQVAAAKHIAGSAARLNARANVQINGGMGYTWEHDAHMLLSRALVLDHCFGDDRDQRAFLLAEAPSIP